MDLRSRDSTLPRPPSPVLVSGFALLAAVACRPSPPPAGPPASQSTAQRIISISPNATETIGLLGQADRLIAVSSFCVWPPLVEKLPRIGGLFDPNLEEIVRLHPDLIILRGRNHAIERLCADQGIRLHVDRTQSFADIETTTRELGRLLDCPSQAERVLADMQTRLAAITRAVAGRPRPRVLLTLSRGPDELGRIMTAARGTYMHQVIEYAGGENIFAGLSVDYPQVSVEAILTLRPEVIIETMPETRPTPGLRQKLLDQWRRLGPIPAVRSGRTFVVTDPHAQIPSPRIVEIVAEVARMLHPEVRID